MKEVTKVFALGSITYKTLNVPGTMRLLAALGVSADPKKSSKLAALNPLLHVANVIEAMGPQITEISAKKDGVEITSFEEALEHQEFMAPLAEIGGELLKQLTTSVAANAAGKPQPKQRKPGKKQKR